MSAANTMNSLIELTFLSQPRDVDLFFVPVIGSIWDW